jgi:hypothetical protein
MFGFKIIVTPSFPFVSPHAYLDEPEKEALYEYIDYLIPVNKLSFHYLDDWQKSYSQRPFEFTLQNLLIKINTLFSH